jgi:hypothetical protein
MFCCVDVFTRYAYIIPMKTKDIISTSNALKIILGMNRIKPNLIMSDNDSSFLGNEFQKVLIHDNIHHDPNAVGDHHSLGIIDNYAKRIKRILTAYFIESKRKVWIDVISKILHIYNTSPHTSLNRITPEEAMANNPTTNQILLDINMMKSKENNIASDLQIGDSVRYRIGNQNTKGTDPRFSQQVLSVKEIYGKNIILDNDKKYIRLNLLKVPIGSESTDTKNLFEEATATKRANTYLKVNNHVDKPIATRLRYKPKQRAVKN